MPSLISYIGKATLPEGRLSVLLLVSFMLREISILNNNRPSALTSAVVLALASITLSPIALAQNRALEEVIVTAQKRAQSVQDVPLSVTSISEETLVNMGVIDTADLTKLSSSLTLAQGRSRQVTSFVIRGIGTNVYSIGVEPSVAVVINESSSDRYRVTLFANNITDENYRAGIADAREFFGGKTALAQVILRAAQSYYGLRVKFAF